MTVDLKDVVRKYKETKRIRLQQNGGVDENVVLSTREMPSDRIACIEQTVAECGGDPQGVVIFSGKSWDEMRLDVATDPEYIDRCRNHPYFQDLLGQAYNGKRFE